MPRRPGRPASLSASPALRWIAAAGLLAACAPRGDDPAAEASPAGPTTPPPEPVTASSSGLPSRDLPATDSDAAPPLGLTASDGTDLRLVSLEARATVQEPLAFTELHLTFENPHARTIEGRFTIDLPPGAAISRFAMKIGAGWQEGEVVERQAARVAYEDFLHRKHDPALMENEAGNRFSARVFPIPANGMKELVVSYSQELTDSDEPYRMMLAGLPELDQLDARILVDRPHEGAATGATSIGGAVSSRRIIEVHERDYVPTRDLEVVSHAPQAATGIRNDELALARVVVAGDMPVEPIGDLTILFDTSASRALGFAGQVRRLAALVQAIREQEGSLHLRVAAFDQDMSLLFDGPAAEFGGEHLRQLYSRRALGASDLSSALRRAATLTGSAGRVLLMTDGVATAGDDEVAALVDATLELQRVGVTRIDAIIDGGLQDADALRAITTAGLPHDGIVADARLPAVRLADKLRRATLSNVGLSVTEAAWSWPRTVSGVQPGDEVLVYAQIPAERGMEVVVEGETTIRTTVPLTQVERPLLHRAWMGARIDALQLQHDKLDPETDADALASLRRQIVAMSVDNRVLSDFTALLVLESEADYRRFDIDRRSLADILVIGADGLEWLRRADAPVPAAAPRHAARFGFARPTPSPEYMAPPSDPGKPVDVWGGLTGTEVGEAYGVGGLGLVGTGRGGGGVGEDGYGRGTGFGGRGRSVPLVRQAKATVVGDLDKDIIRRIVRAHINEVRYCYDQGLSRDPTLAGRVAVQFTIRPTGKVGSSHVAETSVPDARVARCISKAVKRWRFPRPGGGGSADVLHPFVLSPGRSDARAERAPRRPPPPPPTPAELAAERQRLEVEAEAERRREAAAEAERLEAERTKGSPYEGRMYDVMTRLDAGDTEGALALALAWKDEAPGDVVAHLALGEVLQARGQAHAAARAYGSIIDLFPSRADLRRHASSRIESLGGPGIGVAANSYAHAAKLRPDHPSSHRMLAFARLRAGQYAQAFDAIEAGITQVYPEDRFLGADRILREDAGLIAAAWMAAAPEQAPEIHRRAREANIAIATTPSTRFVMTWETDANDVDVHIRDAEEGHAWYGSRELPSGGSLYADVTTGYGPECFTIEGQPDAFPYRFDAHYFSRGPMGYGMGTLQIVAFDGAGQLLFEDRPYLIMKDGAEVALGELTGPLQPGARPRSAGRSLVRPRRRDRPADRPADRRR